MEPNNIIDMLPEIQDQIFGLLCRTDLLNFACTSKDSYTVTKYLLFREININQTNATHTPTLIAYLENIKFITSISVTNHRSCCNPGSCHNPGSCNHGLSASFCAMLEHCDPDKLVTLQLSRFNMTQQVMKLICTLISLKMLTLEYCYFTVPSCFDVLKSLRRLNVQHSNITEVGVSHICKMELLEELDLSFCNNLHDKSLENLHVLKCLRKLSLSCTNITQIGVLYICKTLSIEELNLSRCYNLEDESLNYLHVLKSLTRLDVSRTDISQVGLSHICRVASLECLNLSHCDNLFDESLILLYLHMLSSLKQLNVSGTKITGIGLLHICRVESLEDIDLSRCSHLEDDSLVCLHMLKSLKKLDVSRTKVTQKGVPPNCKVVFSYDFDFGLSV